MSFTPVVVTMSYIAPNGTPQTGTVRFFLETPMANGGVQAHGEIPPVQIVNGVGQTTLYANDDPDTQPAGTSYTVVEQIDGLSARKFPVIISGAVSPVKLADLAPPEGSPLYSYVTPAQLATVVDAAAEAAASTAIDVIADSGVVRSSSTTPSPQPLVVSGEEDGTDTWIQAEGTIDPDLNLALPTEDAMAALGKKGVARAAGQSVVPADGGFEITGENDEPTWLQAAQYVSDATGLAPPTKAALATLSGEGVMRLVLGAAPVTVPDLVPGQVLVYYDPTTGECIADIGVE